MGRRPFANPIDWPAVEAAWRSTDATLQAIADRFKLDPTTIEKRMKKAGISRGDPSKAKRSLVARKLAKETSNLENGKPVDGLAEAEADADVLFLNRAAKAATKSLANCERLLEIAGEALKPKDVATVDAFEAGKANKIATETLGIARATYAKARHIEDDSKVNVNLTGDQIVSGLSGVIDEVVRMASKRVHIVAGAVIAAQIESGESESEVIDVEASGEAG